LGHFPVDSGSADDEVFGQPDKEAWWMSHKARILSGHRPTGKLHIGHLKGALENWVQLQKEYECFFEIALWHALTTDYEDVERVRKSVLEVATDWLAAGLDPELSTIFVQSDVVEHAELHLLLSMIVPVSWLERNPTLKEQIRDLNLEGRVNYGHLGYPVLQAADIIIYRANAVPVGEDQLAHVELTREIVRRFNGLYGEVFPEPQSLVTQFSKVPGLDGRKMSKSLGNAILLSDTEEEIQRKVGSAFTDPTKVYKGDPGHPDECLVFEYHRIFATPHLDGIKKDCSSGELGCVECKRSAGRQISEYLLPIRQKREEIKRKKGYVEGVLREGASRARKAAQETMDLVRAAMKIWIGG
jgi:tryptophanyl-tRNA synthetase